jgi:hypothetical protein
MQAQRIVKEAAPLRPQSDKPRAYCDPDLLYVVTSDPSSDEEGEFEEDQEDEEPVVKSHGIVDSGASISVTSEETAAHFNLVRRPWDKPKRITFGNGDVVESTHYVDFNDVFTHVAIIPGAPDTLLSIANLVRRGFEIRMSKLGMGVFLGDKVVFRGAIDREMFYMDIEELIQSRFKVAEPTSVEETPVVASSQPASVTAKVFSYD